MKINFKLVFKLVYLISSIPILIVLYMAFENEIFNNIFIELLLSLIVLNIIIVIDNIKNRDYTKYKLENPDKRKLGYPFLYLAIFSVFFVPKLIFKPIISNVNNFVLLAGVLMLYVAFFLFYLGFIYKLVKDYNLNPKSFNPFKIVKNIDHMELIAYELEKIGVYQKMLVAKNRLIVVNRSGIYEFINFDKSGVLIGDINDKEWEYNDININNPFLLIGENIYNYFITNTKTKFTLNGVGIVSRGGITPLIQKNLQHNIFDNKTIDEIYNRLEVKYGYNKDKIY